MKQQVVRVGKIVGTFGIKGEVKVAIISDFYDERFKKGKRLILQNLDQSLELVIRSVRYHKECALLQFENYLDLTSVEKLRGNLVIPIDELPNDEGIHSFEYKDCEVFDESGLKRGIVLNWEAGSTHGLLRVQCDQKVILIPLVDAFILKKNVKEKRIVVRWMEGL